MENILYDGDEDTAEGLADGSSQTSACALLDLQKKLNIFCFGLLVQIWELARA